MVPCAFEVPCRRPIITTLYMMNVYIHMHGYAQIYIWIDEAYPFNLHPPRWEKVQSFYSFYIQFTMRKASMIFYQSQGLILGVGVGKSRRGCYS